MENNIKNTALIFEGGGMRACYTAGFLNTLLDNQLYFDYVAGISAGASHIVNYLSRDTKRAKKSFVDLVLDPNFGGISSFLKGEGYFRAKYIYEETPYENGFLPFNLDAFMANQAQFRIGAFECEAGKVRYFSNEDIKNLPDLMKAVRSSSSLPILMPPTFFKGKYFVDGGLGGGIALDIAKKDGYEKFFVVLTREKGYRKDPVHFQKALKMYYRKYPSVAKALITRHEKYNQTLDELEQLEREGKAFLVYPETMPVNNRERNHSKLNQCYELGYAQGNKDVHKWKEFLLN